MKFKYNNLSPGYIGKKCKNATLNSQYYSLFFEETNKSSAMLNSIMIFPQRIPRRDFFVELCTLETIEYRNNFNAITIELKNNHLKSLNKLSISNYEADARNYINWSNILLRYGCFEHLINYFPKNYSGPFSLEIELLRETAKIEILLSDDGNVSIDEQLELSDIFINDKKTSDREKIMLLNQIIVNFYRHQKNSSPHKSIFNLCKVLYDLVQKFENNNFINTLYCSVAYRGLAMAHEFGDEMQLGFLIKAEDLARNIYWKTEIEKVVAAENLFTCLQSISKWHLYKKDILKSECYLRELTSIDPHDSTSHSELGFFYIDIESHEKAANCFMKAMKLGPPGAGMNAYYYAKCLEKLGQELGAITYLYESTKLDKHAISAWLDLMNHFINQDQNDKAHKIANHIYHTPTLLEQLEDEEKITIQSLIN